MLNAEVRKCVFFARARKYDSSLQSALQPVEVPEAVYHNLIEAVHQNMGQDVPLHGPAQEDHGPG